MALETPYFLGAVEDEAEVEYSAREMRLPLDVIAYLDGVASPYSFQVKQRAEGANPSVDILSGVAVVSGDQATGQGKYAVRNNGKVNSADVGIVIPGLPASGMRRHRLVLRILDKQAGATEYGAVFALIQDTAGTGGLPAIPTGWRCIDLAEIRRTAGQAGGTSVLDAHIVGFRHMLGSLPVVVGHFDFVGCNGLRLNKNVTTRFGHPSMFLRNYAVGCIVPDEHDGLVTNLLPGPWRFSLSAKMNGNGAGPRAGYIQLNAPNGAKERAAAPAGPDASGSIVNVTFETIVDVGGCSVEALLWQNVGDFTNVNDEGNFSRFTGRHLGSLVPSTSSSFERIGF